MTWSRLGLLQLPWKPFMKISTESPTQELSQRESKAFSDSECCFSLSGPLNGLSSTTYESPSLRIDCEWPDVLRCFDPKVSSSINNLMDENKPNEFVCLRGTLKRKVRVCVLGSLSITQYLFSYL